MITSRSIRVRNIIYCETTNHYVTFKTRPSSNPSLRKYFTHYAKTKTFEKVEKMFWLLFTILIDDVWSQNATPEAAPAAAEPNYTTILETMFEGYEKEIPPNADLGTTTPVDVGFYILDMYDLSDHDMVHPCTHTCT